MHDIPTRLSDDFSQETSPSVQCISYSQNPSSQGILTGLLVLGYFFSTPPCELRCDTSGMLGRLLSLRTGTPPLSFGGGGRGPHFLVFRVDFPLFLISFQVFSLAV